MERGSPLNQIKAILIIWLWLTFGHVPSAFGQVACEKVHKPSFGAIFLHQRNSTLHTSNSVRHRAGHVQNITGRSLQKPPEKIQAWLDHLDQSYKKYQNNPQALKHLKTYFYDQFVTKFENVPESFYDLQIRIAREQGHGDITVTKEQRKQLADISIQDQKKSLDPWLEYFLSKDSEMYPIWTKYWSLMAVVKMGKYDPSNGIFGSRSKNQMSPFPELNREALAYVIDALVKKVEGKSLGDIRDPGFLSLLEGASFSKLYGKALHSATPSAQRVSSVQGRWVTYQQGSDPIPLVNSLKGMNTGWCTAGESTAKEQLKNGDFQVFYSNDENGVPRIPRIAIRMEGSSIREIRGTAKDQNLDPQIASTPLLQRKLEEFGAEGRSYQKKISDMRLLTSIEKKQNEQDKLTTEELRFLYEVDESIQGFGYDRDPRIDKIKKTRNIKYDFVQIYDYKINEAQVSVSPKEAFRKGVKIHIGSLDLAQADSSTGFRFPEVMFGNLIFRSLKSAEGWVLPKELKGTLIIDSLQSARGLVLPEKFDGKILFSDLRSPEGMVLPQEFKGELNFFRLKTVEGLILPKKFKGNLHFAYVNSFKGLSFPDEFKGELEFQFPGVTQGMVLPKRFEGLLRIFSLDFDSAEGIVLPLEFKGKLDLSYLETARGLVLPKKFEGLLDLSHIESVEGLVLPEGFRGTILIRSSHLVKKVILPKGCECTIRTQ